MTIPPSIAGLPSVCGSQNDKRTVFAQAEYRAQMPGRGSRDSNRIQTGLRHQMTRAEQMKAVGYHGGGVSGGSGAVEDFLGIGDVLDRTGRAVFHQDASGGNAVFHEPVLHDKRLGIVLVVALSAADDDRAGWIAQGAVPGGLKPGAQGVARSVPLF